LPSPADEAFTRALAALQTSQVDDAERFFKKALRLQPRHVPALNVYSILLTQGRRYEEAEQYITRAIRENATSDVSFYNYGVILKALKRPQEAIEQFNRALAIKGAVAETLNARGEAYFELERFAEARADFDQALVINPNFVEALVNRARALTETEEFEPGLKAADQALALRPANALAWLARGHLLNALKRTDEALDAFARALAIQPDLAEAWLGRGSSFVLLKRHQEALTAFDRLIAIKPDDTDAWHGYADSLFELGRTDEAMTAYQKAMALDPDHAPVHGSLGNLLMVLGRFDEANQIYRKAIELDPQTPGFYGGLVSTKKFTAEDVAAMEALAADESVNLSKRKRMVLDFTLGRAYEDNGDRRRAFQHLLAGNTAQRSLIDYDEAQMFRRFENMANIFTPELIAAKSGAGVNSPRPIFIVGMPRSGSTLAEQILASHPAVEGAGEVQTFFHAMHEATGRAQNPQVSQGAFPDFVPALDGETIRSIGETYLTSIAKLAPSNKERITDKMLSNFWNVGLIHLVFPNAAILHTTRNPIDNCVSIFSLNFKEVIPYAYDLAELGRFYMHCRGLMEHWHRVLPPGRVLDVQYEDTVADLEGQARRIVAHCGLPWDDRCLSFHKTERPVRTASLAQVRQPIYKSSVDRWRVYEEFLGPLLKELGIDAQATA
jgi:tetratricopeptide (TPR) repeat protein